MQVLNSFIHGVAPWARRIGLAAGTSLMLSTAWAGGSVLDLGNSVPSPADVRDGLFPEDADCLALMKNGYKCMNFKPPVRYSIPASAFALGSAEIPEGLKPQLNVFAEVLSNQKGDPRRVKVIGHADATGSAEFNKILSEKRAEEVKKYLVARGADPGMLEIEGLGSKQPIDQTNPASARNRRVEIGRTPQ